MTAGENAKLDLIHSDLKIVKEIVTGNGDPKKGLVVRVDRLEQISKLRKTIYGAVLVAVLAAVATGLWDKFFVR